MNSCNLTRQDDFRIAPEDIRSSVEILKEGQMFMNSLPGGEIPCQDTGGLGFYYADTRFLSCLELRLNGTEPIFLSRSVRDSHIAQVELTNKDFVSKGQLVPLHTIHLRLLRLVRDGFYQRLRLINFNQYPVELTLRFRLGADFADIFEVRGTRRQVRGQRLKPEFSHQGISLGYQGQDGVVRKTRIYFAPAPSRIGEEGTLAWAEYKLVLQPQKKYYLYLKIQPWLEESRQQEETLPRDLGFKKAAGFLIQSYRDWIQDCINIITDNQRFNQMLRVGITDLRALTTHYPGKGAVLEAGIPWYAAPFGRDSLITAWQTLLVNPWLARETLLFLARYQGEKIDPWRDEEPGKILHELRLGEMARAGEIPHTPYYGSVDSTLWFIILLAAYYRWTGERELLEKLRPNLERAIHWCEVYGDRDQDGYIEYQCQSERGLINQGWKDSWDGVIDSDGQLPTGPIALVEVQGYYYLALREAAFLYQQLGVPSLGEQLLARARSLQAKFLQDFWLLEEEFLAFALDGQKRKLKTIVSNPGHCLFTGILPPEYADKVARRLFAPDLFSGWGIRTMSDREKAYNPMSYHNGSVWPHDNAIIGYGLRQAGQLERLCYLTETLFAAAEYFPQSRLPELFCGFTRRGNAGPVKYPIACDPQAWAVGSIFLLLKALLGVECRGNQIFVRQPLLPDFLKTLRLENIRVGEGRVDLEFTRRNGKTYCGVTGTTGQVQVIFA
ncbi:Glycogen debranching enzyme (alpha-1,6-glucosidase) [Carboxydocella sporoproducens DSM 16521]|uniref:Glycogen debranching enzyme (Alpha-1,6-glucosidase) n=2 Tax=Carboxydocella TaxID=178898 RepID=A0A1T4MVZ8_9FIRM|nr:MULTISPECIES: amylo-alpha-1,6-glucosidase [Carboxydocella]AVX20304.1 Glycogen debranching enzyme (alpha-1,6-glucosidase) [Carboxydocella thermautotrophica]SJZ71133.1 Glycogen debranching enzyme (alpha-1,6-glucosidase) [Carboxydocella sporoproducens DSM 16521]